MTNDYMTLWETIVYDLGCALEFIWTAVEYIFAYTVCALASLIAIVATVLAAFMYVDFERRCTQWYYGTGEFAKR